MSEENTPREPETLPDKVENTRIYALAGLILGALALALAIWAVVTQPDEQVVYYPAPGIERMYGDSYGNSYGYWHGYDEPRHAIPTYPSEVQPYGPGSDSSQGCADGKECLEESEGIK